MSRGFLRCASAAPTDFWSGETWLFRWTVILNRGEAVSVVKTPLRQKIKSLAKLAIRL
jgi:hypothetical protein